MKKKILVGITGGMGAGKSAVSKIIEKMGYPVLSADFFAREVTKPGAPALAEIRVIFGEKALLTDGSLNRSHIREAIVHDPALRLQLEAITHPLIQQLTLEQTTELFSSGKDIVFYEAPLLFEANSDKSVDKVICVHASEPVRIARVAARDGVSAEQARKLMSAQLPQEKMRRSDYLIENEDDEEKLEALTKAVVHKIR